MLKLFILIAVIVFSNNTLEASLCDLPLIGGLFAKSKPMELITTIEIIDEYTGALLARQSFQTEKLADASLNQPTLYETHLPMRFRFNHLERDLSDEDVYFTLRIGLSRVSEGINFNLYSQLSVSTQPDEIVGGENVSGLFNFRTTSLPGLLIQIKSMNLRLDQIPLDRRYLDYYSMAFSGYGDVDVEKALNEIIKQSPNDDINLDGYLDSLVARKDMRREYAVVTSVHGSKFRVKNADGNFMKQTLYTLPEARLVQFLFTYRSKTSGGKSLVIHAPSWHGDISNWPFISNTKDLLEP